MQNNLVLTLMQIPHISRKTINKIFLTATFLPKDAGEIYDLFVDANYKNKRIAIPSLDDIKKAECKAGELALKCRENGIGMVSTLDDNFPEKLKYIQDPPVLLYYRGNFNCLHEHKSIAIVGTRNPTEHGIRIAQRLGFIFGDDNFVVVSGLALGCDEFAHKGCVSAKGKSVAVLPGGLDKVYPARNKQLATDILENDGCLVSEYPVGVRPFKSFFVDRDRLQSGLGSAVLVVETDVVGGTIHTAGYAIAQKRILACYRHANKYLHTKQTQGNQMLINEKRALSIGNEEDIKNLKVKIIESDYIKSKVENHKRFSQTSFI